MDMIIDFDGNTLGKSKYPTYSLLDKRRERLEIKREEKLKELFCSEISILRETGVSCILLRKLLLNRKENISLKNKFKFVVALILLSRDDCKKFLHEKEKMGIHSGITFIESKYILKKCENIVDAIFAKILDRRYENDKEMKTPLSDKEIGKALAYGDMIREELWASLSSYNLKEYENEYYIASSRVQCSESITIDPAFFFSFELKKSGYFCIWSCGEKNYIPNESFCVFVHVLYLVDSNDFGKRVSITVIDPLSRRSSVFANEIQRFRSSFIDMGIKSFPFRYRFNKKLHKIKKTWDRLKKMMPNCLH